MGVLMLILIPYASKLILIPYASKKDSHSLRMIAEKIINK